jgi:hypothetical protein
MTFDAMAVAVDWLDAYRAEDIDAIVKMYSEDAVIECGCGGETTIVGRNGLQAYWMQRLREYPASDLDGLQPSADGATISYVTRDGVVGAVLEFDSDGRIVFSRCGPRL